MLSRSWYRKVFDEYNQYVFDGKLKRVPITDGYAGPGYWGWCFGNRILLSDQLTEDEARCTLLHEMVHLWQFQMGLDMNHGRSFKPWEKKCKRLTGLSVHLS